MDRRDFVKALGLAPLAMSAPQLVFAALPQAQYKNLLVLVELKGGNDGLNTVIPYSDPEYYRLRPRLSVSRDSVIQLDGKVGLHPGMQALLPLWQGRELAIIQGVGYPQPNLSHFRSIEIWETASDSDEYREEGWLARTFAAYPAPSQFAADGITVGSQELGPLYGPGTRAIALQNPEQFSRQARLANDAGVSSTNPALTHILKVEDDIQHAAAGIMGQYSFKTQFPRGRFAETLKTAARVIAGKSAVAVMRITHNGFDTHSNQTGVHAKLLRELAESLAAFKDALLEMNRWDATLVMTYAEFGRRPRENMSGGTDHGTVNAHFMMGGRIKGGLYGQTTQLNRLDGSGNLAYAVDFRSVYATALKKWWGIDPEAVLGRSYPTLDVIQA